MMFGSLSRKNNKISHKVKKDLHTNRTSSYHQQSTVELLKSLLISTIRFGFLLLICQKIFHFLNHIKRCLSFSMVSEEYRRVEASSSSVTLNEGARTLTPARIMLDDETIQKYRKKMETLSTDERKAEFVKEKNQGNECFKRSRYELAIQHYTKCILSEPNSAVAYSNRAQAFLKMNKYTQALEDCNAALRIDPSMVKAKYRRGLALHHKNMFYEALQDFEDVVKNEPNNFIANHYVSKLRELLNSQPRKIMLLSNETSGQGAGKGKVIQVPEKDYHLNPKYRHCVQVNEWGLVKPFCSCNNGEPEFIRQHRKLMETKRRKQRELSLPLKSKSDNNVTQPNTNNILCTNQSEPNMTKLNNKRTDESVNILAKGFMKSLSKEKVPPEPESVSILESTLLSGEPIAQNKSLPLIRNMPLLGDETETQVELEESRNNYQELSGKNSSVTNEKILQDSGNYSDVAREHNHGDCDKTDNQQKQDQLESNKPAEQQTTIQLANCNEMDHELKLDLVQQKTEKEVENKFILESRDKNRSNLKSKDETIGIFADTLKQTEHQTKVRNIFTIIRPPKQLNIIKQDTSVENKLSNVLKTNNLTPSKPLTTTNRISLDNKATEKPLEDIQANLTNTANENEPPVKVLTKAQKRQIRRSNFKRQSQDSREGDMEQRDRGDTMFNTETNHVTDNQEAKVSTKSKKETCKTNGATKPQATRSDTTTAAGEKKRLKRKISTNCNKTKLNETDGDMEQGQSEPLNKHAEQVFKKYEDKVYSKYIEQKNIKDLSEKSEKNIKDSSAIELCLKNPYSEEFKAKRCSDKKVNKWLNSNTYNEEQSNTKVNKWLNTYNEEQSNTKVEKNAATTTLTSRKRNSMTNGLGGGGDV
ncbi:hypothetical protein WDU94_007433 [Cyamophila willieti]